MRKYLGLAIILLGFSILYIVQDESSSQDMASMAPSDTAQNLPYDQKKVEQFNYHLYKTQQQMNAGAYNSYLQNAKKAPDLHEVPDQERVNLKQYGVDQSPDKYEAHSVEKFNQKNQPDYYSPEYQIQTQLYEKQMLSQYDEAYKRAYAEQFVENARQAGYHVKLDEHYKVIGVRPIKKSQSIKDVKVIDSNQGAVQ